MKYWKLGAALAILFTLISWYSWERAAERFQSLEPQPQSHITVATVEVKHSQLNEWIYLEGVARAVKKVHLAFEVDGRVAAIESQGNGELLREGSIVSGPEEDKPGQLLARLDDRDYRENLRIAQTQLTQSQREVDIAKAQLQQSHSAAKLAKQSLGRIKTLRKRKLSTKEQLDQALAQWELDQAGVIAAKAELAAKKASVLAAEDNVTQAKRNFDRTRIYAPWKGTIARLNIRIGDYTGPSILDTRNSDTMTASFPITLIDNSQFEIEAEVPKYLSDLLKPGATALLQKQNGSPRQPLKDKDQWYQAKLYTIAPILSPMSRTVRAKIRSQGKLPLLDGELVQVKLKRQQKHCLNIPMDAVIMRDNQAHAFIVQGETVALKKISLGIRQDSQVEVSAGLQLGDRVVTEGRQRLIDGDKVILVNPANHNGSPGDSGGQQ